MGTSKANLDLSGTPSLIALSGNELRLGTEGDNDVVFVRNGSVVGRISSAGLVAQFDLANNSWLQARNAANSADLDLLRATAANATQLNTASGTRLSFSVNGTNQWLIDTATLLGAVTTGTNYIVGTNSADGADTNTICLTAADVNSTSRAATLTLYGNENVGVGIADLRPGNVTGASIKLMSIQNGVIIQNGSASPMWTFGSAGTLTQDATNGGDITFAKTLTGITGLGKLNLERTNTAGGTTGAQTINKISGSVNFAVAASSLVVTNSLVSATSNIIAVLQNNDATAKSCSVTPGVGSFTINLNAAATAETRVAFWVTN